MARSYRQYNVHITEDEDKWIKDLAGPGNLGAFIREAIIQHAEKVQRERDEADAGGDGSKPDIFGDEG